MDFVDVISLRTYEKAIEGVLSALLYPNLTNPNRKRIDITYTNMALNSLFKWLAMHYAAAHVFVECKKLRKGSGESRA